MNIHGIDVCFIFLEMPTYIYLLSWTICGKYMRYVGDLYLYLKKKYIFPSLHSHVSLLLWIYYESSLSFIVEEKKNDNFFYCFVFKMDFFSFSSFLSFFLTLFIVWSVMLYAALMLWCNTFSLCTCIFLKIRYMKYIVTVSRYKHHHIRE